MPTRPATSATRRPARSRSAVRDAGGASRLLAVARLGLAVGLEGLRALRRVAELLRPRRGLHRHGQPGRHGEPDARSSPRSGTTASGPSASARCSPRPRRSRPATMSQIQGDTRNTYAPGLVERLLAVQVDDFTAQAQRLLRDWDGSQPNDKSRDCGVRGVLQRRVEVPARVHLRRAPARHRARRRQPVDGRHGAAAQGPEERLVGRQDDPGRHRGLRRDPQAGARRGPSRPRPRARQGPRDVALGTPAPARPQAPGDGRRRGARRSSRTSSTATASSSAVATPSSTPTPGTPRSPATA